MAYVLWHNNLEYYYTCHIVIGFGVVSEEWVVKNRIHIFVPTLVY